ncbi:MAG: glucose-1-phosphate cytidylyltransferase [Clostridiales Family XIII bacterium]|jgi:glucose-1-phosphate cytidylyltransferase|nr:glucose-1-phosphate cytidylyltransferase [Clostridiales Family XIII bacterium]
MKVVILAGGLGSRLSEETEMKPKPMVEIGGHPILWHIMKIYSYYGFNEFIILTGYKSHIIKEYFINYYTRYSDIVVNLENNTVELHKARTEPWRVTILYTGADTMTGGRIVKAKGHLKNESFLLTYGDGVSDININSLVDFHKRSGKIITATAAKPIGRFGVLDIDENSSVVNFKEKPHEKSSWINGGFFVCEPEVFNYIDSDDACVFERKPLEKLSADQQFNAYKHRGFWRSMDTLKEKNELTEMWFSGICPWAVWLKN